MKICNFLQSLVSDIDLDSLKPASDGPAIECLKNGVTNFDPVRRKLEIIGA